MSKGIFITGTGTDVGKTFVSALITKKLRDNNINAGYYKPALSGCEYIDGKLVCGDAEFVCKTSNLNIDPNSLVSFFYETPVSPHLAAKLEDNPIEISTILSDFNNIKSQFDFITVEGCGGLICPIRIDNDLIMLTDIIKTLNLDMILVASASLGTINSTLLTVEYAKQQNLNIKGIILNNYDSNNFVHLDNKKQIEDFTKIPVIACIKYNSNEIEIDINDLLDLYKGV